MDPERIELNDWSRALAEYQRSPEDFHAAWHYLTHHPIYTGSEPFDNRFTVQLRIEVVKVNPANDRIDDNPELNTQTEIWLESGPTYLRYEIPDSDIWDHCQDDVFDNIHDYRLDCAGKTFEQAIVEHAKLVNGLYGNDRSRVYDH